MIEYFAIFLLSYLWLDKLLYFGRNIKIKTITQKYLMSKLILGYWKIRGLGQYLRLLLSYTGLEFEEVQYDNPDKWFL